MESRLEALGVDPINIAIARQLADAIRDQWQKVRKTLRRCQRAFSEDAVHDARVSCRRLIARLTLVRAALGESSVDPLLRNLKRLLTALSHLRDVQVQQAALTEGLRGHPEIAGLWIELTRREEDLIQAGTKTVARFKTGKLDRRLAELCAALEDPVMQLSAKTSLREATLRAMREAFMEVLRRRDAIVASRPATIHRVRVAYKKFRYMVESLPPALGRVSTDQLHAMAEQQRAMGEIQDIEVRLRLVETHAREHPMTSQGLERYRRALLHQRRALVQAFARHADGLALLWPECLPMPFTSSTKNPPTAPQRDEDPQLEASA